MSILERIEASLAGFQPRNQAEFAALQLAVAAHIKPRKSGPTVVEG